MSETTRDIDYDLEIQKIDDEIANLEREKAGLPEPLTWDELQKAGALKKAQEADTRRGFIPRLQRAASIKRLELEIAKQQRVITEIEGRQAELYAELEPKREQLLELQQRVNILSGEHTQGIHRIQERHRRIREAQREIHNLQGENLNG